MTEREKYHYNVGQVKASIIEILLNEKGHVEESLIRKRLNEKYGVISQPTISKHLHDLKEMNSIELLPPIKKGLGNRWNVIGLKNLQSIRLNFPLTELNKFEKSVTIILWEFGYNLSTIEGLKFYTRLFLSRSFFDMCMANDSETLRLRTWEFYKYNRGFPFHPLIEKHRGYYEKIEKDNLPKFLDVQDMLFKILSELPDDIPKDQLGLSTILGASLGKINEISEDERIRNWLDSFLTAYVYTIHNDYFYLLCDNFCFYQDVLQNNTSLGEKEFMSKTADNLASLLEIDWKKRLPNGVNEWKLKDLQLISEVIYKRKTPSSFGTFNSQNEVEQFLNEKYKKEFGFKNIIKSKNENS
jgi:hypothetical protein